MSSIIYGKCHVPFLLLRIKCNRAPYEERKKGNHNSADTVINTTERERKMTVRRGDIFYADLSPVVGSEQGGIRPVLIVQNDVGNKYSPTVIAAAITSQTEKTNLPTHITVSSYECGLQRDSIVLLEQIRTLDKRRLRECMGRLEENVMNKIDKAISISFGLSTAKDI